MNLGDKIARVIFLIFDLYQQKSVYFVVQYFTRRDVSFVEILTRVTPYNFDNLILFWRASISLLYNSFKWL